MPGDERDEIGSPDDGRGQAPPTRHDPVWLNASRYGRWCVCSCGWESSNGTPNHAQVEFGNHLLRCVRANTWEAM